MKYCVIKVINGNFLIDSEWGTNLQGAIVQYFGLCRTLWNEPTVITAYVMIVNEQFDVVNGYKEFIHHDSAPEPVSAE